MGMILLLRSVSIPPITGNFIILCVVDGTAFIFRNPGLPMIPLNGDVDLTTMKSIHVDVEWGLPLPHRSPGVGMISTRSGCENFELSSILLHFAVTGSLKLPEASLFRRSHLSVLLQLPDYMRQFPGFEHILNLFP
ncbi:hypothetical protein Tco_1317472 [Tanacetum coccineum]